MKQLVAASFHLLLAPSRKRMPSLARLVLVIHQRDLACGKPG
jgi:hypothetical protein